MLLTVFLRSSILTFLDPAVEPFFLPAPLLLAPFLLPEVLDVAEVSRFFLVGVAGAAACCFRAPLGDYERPPARDPDLAAPFFATDPFLAATVDFAPDFLDTGSSGTS